MTRIHLNQVPVHSPLAQAIQNRPGRERQWQDRTGRVRGHHVLHKLVQQRNVAVDHKEFGEPVEEAGPAAEIVDAEDLSGEAKLASETRHVDRGGSEEGADLDYEAGPDLADEVLENGAVGAPALDALWVEEVAHVRGREVAERGGPVEEFLENCGAN